MGDELKRWIAVGRGFLLVLSRGLRMQCNGSKACLALTSVLTGLWL